SGADAFVGIGIRCGEIASDTLHVDVCLCDRDAGFQSSDSMKTKPRRTIHQNRIVPLPHWDIKFAGAHCPQQIKVFRDHADDRVAFAVKREALADDIACRAEFALPESGSNHRYRGRSDEVFPGGEVPPDRRNNAQLPEKIRTHKLRVDLFGLTEAAKDK